MFFILIAKVVKKDNALCSCPDGFTGLAFIYAAKIQLFV
jgi:hypothetical protein